MSTPMKDMQRSRRAPARTRNVAIGIALLVVLVIALVLMTGRRAPASAKAVVPDTKIARSTAGTVRVTPAQLGQFGVTFGTVERRVLSTESRVAGVVTMDESRLSQVAPKYAGFVERLYVNATGQPVRRGQALADVYSPDLISAQQELLLASRLQRDVGRSGVPGMPSDAPDLVTAAKRRLQLWDVSDAQIAEVLRRQKVRRTLTLFSPASGIVLEKKVMQGQAITAGEPLYTIADLATVWVDVSLRQSDAAEVRTGTSADIELTGVTGRTFKGRVTYVYPTLDSTSRSVRARVVVTNTDAMLKPGMYATVRLSTPSRSALAVPTSALLHTGDRTIAFRDMGNGEVMPVDVEVGRSAGEYTEVLAGLADGTRVVTSAQFLLDSESNLGEVMKSMIGQAGVTDHSSHDGMRDMPGMNAPAASTDPSTPRRQ